MTSVADGPKDSGSMLAQGSVRPLVSGKTSIVVTRFTTETHASLGQRDDWHAAPQTSLAPWGGCDDERPHPEQDVPSHRVLNGSVHRAPFGSRCLAIRRRGAAAPACRGHHLGRGETVIAIPLRRKKKAIERGRAIL
jgi:hypothetical protein